MTYDVRLTIAAGQSADAATYSTNSLLQLSDDAYATLATFASPNITPQTAPPPQPWVVTTAANLLQAVATGQLDLPAIKPEIFKFLELVALVEPGKIGISTTPTPTADLRAGLTVSADAVDTIT